MKNAFVCHAHVFFQVFINHYMLDTVIGVENKQGNKSDMIYDVMEFSFLK